MDDRNLRWNRALLLVIPLSLWLALLCQAQSQLPYQQLLLLVTGPSGDTINPEEQAVVSYLSTLRAEYGLSRLQMGTMHFDRPGEARILKEVLGLTPASGVSVALVQLSPEGMPLRALYKREKVTADLVRREHRELLGRWSALTTETLPATLTQETAVTEPPADTGQLFTPEGVRNTVVVLDQRVARLWDNFKGRPLREDRMDIPLRNATAVLAQTSANLKLSSDRGLVYPLPELKAVRMAGREWKDAEPRYYLPVDLRNEVVTLLQLLEMVEAIEAQATKN